MLNALRKFASVYEISGELNGRGALNFFSGRGVRPGFPKCGACKLILASEKGACELKFPNLRACELKISQFGGGL